MKKSFKYTLVRVPSNLVIIEIQWYCHAHAFNDKHNKVKRSEDLILFISSTVIYISVRVKKIHKTVNNKKKETKSIYCIKPGDNLKRFLLT